MYQTTINFTIALTYTLYSGIVAITQYFQPFCHKVIIAGKYVTSVRRPGYHIFNYNAKIMG